jgi:hypothetical protein
VVDERGAPSDVRVSAFDNVTVRDGHYFHVDPDAVRPDGTIWVCSRCDGAVSGYKTSRKNMPKDCIARGDFGRLRVKANDGKVFDFGDVSEYERLLLAHARVYQRLYRVATTWLDDDQRRSRLETGTITFPQGLAETAPDDPGADMFDERAVRAALERVDCFFTGPSEQFGQMERLMLTLFDMRFRAHVVFNWLQIRFFVPYELDPRARMPPDWDDLCKCYAASRTRIEQIFLSGASKSEFGDTTPVPSDVAGVRAGAREGCPDDAEVTTHAGARHRCGYSRRAMHRRSAPESRRRLSGAARRAWMRRGYARGDRGGGPPSRRRLVRAHG